MTPSFTPTWSRYKWSPAMGRNTSILLQLGPSAQAQVAAAFKEDARGKVRSKFGNSAVVLDGYRFDSKREATEYQALKSELSRGVIFDLRIQPAWRFETNGQFICDYVADFQFRRGSPSGDLVTVDVKSPATKTREYRLKLKLLKAFYGLSVTEIE